MYSTVQYKILYMLQERIRLLVIHIHMYKIGAAQHRLGKQEVNPVLFPKCHRVDESVLF